MREKAFDVRLIPIDSFQAADYNPRKFDQIRFELIKDSLNALGWLMPAFISNGVLLSGHQRSKAWKELGYTHVPVVVINDLTPEEERGFNILFNLATNDFQKEDLRNQVTTERMEIDAQDKVPYPCLKFSMESPSELITRFNLSSKNIPGWQYTKAFAQSEILIPIIIGSDGQIANGSKRVFAYARAGVEKIPVVYSESPTEVISHYLNKISMDFDLQRTYSDQMRFGSFRRLRLKRDLLGNGFTAWVNMKELDSEHKLDHRIPVNARKLKARFGKSVIDFGAGHLHETNMLRSIGIDVTPFEPYHVIDKDEPSLTASRKIGVEFLEAVAAGKKFDSVVISSVFNSVPFFEDRSHILRIVSSLCDQIFIGTRSTKENRFREVKGDALSYSQNAFKNSQFLANYEDDVVIGEISSGAPKAQKFYSLDSLKDHLRLFFHDVRGFEGGNNIYAYGCKPKPVDTDRLNESLRFEFDLPYPNGQTLGLAEMAIDAWKKRGIL